MSSSIIFIRTLAQTKKYKIKNSRQKKLITDKKKLVDAKLDEVIPTPAIEEILKDFHPHFVNSLSQIDEAIRVNIKFSLTILISNFVLLAINIFLFAILYSLVFRVQGCTKQFIDSLYFSLVTFTTLGYGEITISDSFLRLFSALQALTGLTLTASFTGIIFFFFDNRNDDI